MILTIPPFSFICTYLHNFPIKKIWNESNSTIIILPTLVEIIFIEINFCFAVRTPVDGDELWSNKTRAGNMRRTAGKEHLSPKLTQKNCVGKNFEHLFFEKILNSLCQDGFNLFIIQNVET